MLDVLEAVAAAVGAERLGVRLCPYNIYMDATDSVEAAAEKNLWLMQQLNRRLPGLAYVHMVKLHNQGTYYQAFVLPRTCTIFKASSCHGML
jgi:2,4-dienoyl-CoA reductase-like NADH-dependent reductase (Old Yellow Enzyme family)